MNREDGQCGHELKCISLLCNDLYNHSNKEMFGLTKLVVKYCMIWKSTILYCNCHLLIMIDRNGKGCVFLLLSDWSDYRFSMFRHFAKVRESWDFEFGHLIFLNLGVLPDHLHCHIEWIWVVTEFRDFLILWFSAVRDFNKVNLGQQNIQFSKC